jgi:5'-3' exonuclease
VSAEIQKVIILLDSDIVAFKFASAAQKTYHWPGLEEPSISLEPYEGVIQQMDDYIEDIRAYLNADEVWACLSCPSAEGFRVGILPSYKGNRKDVVKPVYLNPLKDHLEANYKAFRKPGLEADDIMGIQSTHPKYSANKMIIVSEDKDMKTIPGWLYNPAKDLAPRFINEGEANYWHLYQTLVGDATDNYKGCPKVGPVKAEKLLQGVMKGAEECGAADLMWAAVLAEFISRGLITEDEALVQARVARILRWSDYNFDKKEVKLWTPQIATVIPA